MTGRQDCFLFKQGLGQIKKVKNGKVWGVNRPLSKDSIYHKIKLFLKAETGSSIPIWEKMTKGCTSVEMTDPKVQRQSCRILPRKTFKRTNFVLICSKLQIKQINGWKDWQKRCQFGNFHRYNFYCAEIIKKSFNLFQKIEGKGISPKTDLG